MNNKRPKTIGEDIVNQYAVAVILIKETSEEDEILFEIRSEKIGHQPGDICIPGGKVENGELPEEAVVREISEELMIAPEQVEVIRPISILINNSQMIHTFLCALQGYQGSFSRDEVSDVFTVPLAFFRNNKPAVHEVSWHPEFKEDFPFDKIHGGRQYPWRQRKSRIRFYEYEGRVIWGITARIIEDFVADVGIGTMS